MAYTMNGVLEPMEVHIPLEGQLAVRVIGFLDHEVHASALMFDIGSRRVEMNVVGDAHTRLDDR